MAFSSTFGGPRANISLFHLLARVTVNIHVILRKMAKPREKVRNAMLHNYDSARYLASKVINLAPYIPCRNSGRSNLLSMIYTSLLHCRLVNLPKYQ